MNRKRFKHDKNNVRCIMSNKTISNKEVVIVDYAIDYVKKLGFIVIQPKRFNEFAKTMFSITLIFLALIVLSSTNVKADIYSDCSLYGNCLNVNVTSPNGSTINNYYNNTYTNITIINGSSYNETYDKKISFNNTNIAYANNSNNFTLLNIFNRGIQIPFLMGFNKTSLAYPVIFNGTAYPDNQLQTGWFNMSNNVALYHLNDSSGTLKDNSGYGKDLTINGNVYYSAVGNINNSIDCEGGIANVSISHGYNNSFSIAFWYYRNATQQANDFNTMMSVENRSYANYWWAVGFVPNSNVLRFAMYSGSGGATIVDSSLGLTNAWNFVVIEKNATHMTIYVNNNTLAMATNSLVAPPYHTFTICGQTYQPRRFIGKLDEIASFNRTLSTSEVLNIYNSQKSNYDNPIVTTTPILTYSLSPNDQTKTEIDVTNVTFIGDNQLSCKYSEMSNKSDDSARADFAGYLYDTYDDIQIYDSSGTWRSSSTLGGDGYYGIQGYACFDCYGNILASDVPCDIGAC
jgi:hypothetical protein